MITRRQVLLGSAALLAGGVGTGGYASAIEPYRLWIQHYRVQPSLWASGLKLRIAAIADLHACKPWMPLDRVHAIVESANSLGADVIVLLGDYVGSQSVTIEPVDKRDLASALARLRAPLGVHAVLGNHDWWDDREVQQNFAGVPEIQRVLEGAGIPVYENDVQRLTKHGQSFWLCGLGDQWAFYKNRNQRQRPTKFGYLGRDDLSGTLAKLTDDAPAIMLLHEPDIFAEMPDRVALSFAGHTHGGQVQLLGYAPIIPSRYGHRYLYGHIREGAKDLIVSGGLGCSGLPIRFGRPPEIVVVDVEAPGA